MLILFKDLMQKYDKRIIIPNFSVLQALQIHYYFVYLQRE